MVLPQEVSEALTNSRSSIDFELIEKVKMNSTRNTQFLKIYKTVASGCLLLIWLAI